MMIYTTLDINQDGFISMHEFGNSSYFLERKLNVYSFNFSLNNQVTLMLIWFKTDHFNLIHSGFGDYGSLTKADVIYLFRNLDVNNNGRIEASEIDISLKGI